MPAFHSSLSCKIGIQFQFLVILVASLCLGNLSAFSAPPYPLAIACVTNINLNGNNVMVDSFDSSDPNYSDWNTNWGFGTYDQNKAKANGNVGTDGSLVDVVNIGSAEIYGHVDTGPSGSIQSNIYYIGPLPQSGVGPQPGYTNNDMNMVFPDVVLPAGASGWQALPTNAVITNSGNYYSAGVTDNLTIDAPHVTIYVNGNISIFGNSAIIITTNVLNASLYVAGPSAYIGGNGVINFGPAGAGGRAAAFNLYGLPSLTSLSIHANSVFVGTIYAPKAAFMIGGGISTFDFIGALVANSLVFTGNTRFHFDESLAHSMPLWISAQPTNHAVQLGTNATFSISIGGGYAFGYQWFFNQTNLLTGATNSTLSLTNVQFSDAGTYSVAATNWSGSITSALASLIVFTNAAATLTSPALLTNGLQFNITGVTGLNYIVQASTNLADWVSLATNQPPFSFVDTNAPAFPQQFYRVVCFPQ